MSHVGLPQETLPSKSHMSLMKVLQTEGNWDLSSLSKNSFLRKYPPHESRSSSDGSTGHWLSMFITRGGTRWPLQLSHPQTFPISQGSTLNRQRRINDTYFTVAWACPGITGQDRKYFGPRSASGVPKRARHELSWRQTARAQSTVLHTGSQGEGT